MQTMDGFVTLVQESRFQMVDEDGIAHHFVLSHAAAAEPSDLVPLQRRQAHVRVRYSEGVNVIAKTAHRIDVLEATS